jgi:hypothetical protein
MTTTTVQAAPNTKKIWLIPEAVPLAINIAFVGSLCVGSAAYIATNEPYFFLDKHKRKYGDAVYSNYPMPEPKPINFSNQKNTH